tara:strand:+ start:304 stop:606 length:303 start_codon:yes stop_codon:yes gene_type:complete
MPVINRNKNQWRKVYPGVRRTPIYEKSQMMEVGRLYFVNSDLETFKFSNSYDVAPTVTASVYGVDANVSINCVAITRTSATFAASAKFTGEVHVQILEEM